MLSLLYLYTTLHSPYLPSTWMDPDTYQSQQLICTVLPQGFRDSPQFFGQALQLLLLLSCFSLDLQTLDLGSTTSLQCVDDLLLCSSSRHNCLVHTATVLNALDNWGYRVLLSKTQIASSTVSGGLDHWIPWITWDCVSLPHPK